MGKDGRWKAEGGGIRIADFRLPIEDADAEGEEGRGQRGEVSEERKKLSIVLVLVLSKATPYGPRPRIRI